MTVPFKKPKNGELTQKQKDFNRELSSERILVEHVIGKLKFFKILSNSFRNRINQHELLFKNIAGIYNLMLA